jgi:malate dehydrogenase
MPVVAIVGAGALGGDVAHVLARRDVVPTIRLIDETGQVAAGKALDIRQAAPIEGFTTAVSGSTDVTTAAGATVIVLADRSAGGEWQTEDGLLLLKRLAEFARSAVVVCAGAGQRELVERGVRELKYERRRLLGSAPEAFVAAVRAMVALETQSSPTDVALTVLGVPPFRIVVPWEDAAIGGLAATSVLAEPVRRRLAARVGPLWPPGPYALASAAAGAVQAIIKGTRHRLAAFVAPDDGSGRRARAAALPVRLGLEGIVQVEMPVLNSHDRVALDTAMLL